MGKTPILWRKVTGYYIYLLVQQALKQSSPNRAELRTFKIIFGLPIFKQTTIHT
jgi:hypothetical protein